MITSLVVSFIMAPKYTKSTANAAGKRQHGTPETKLKTISANSRGRDVMLAMAGQAHPTQSTRAMALGEQEQRDRSCERAASLAVMPVANISQVPISDTEQCLFFFSLFILFL